MADHKEIFTREQESRGRIGELKLKISRLIVDYSDENPGLTQAEVNLILLEMLRRDIQEGVSNEAKNV